MAGVNDYSALSRNPDETSPELHGSNPEKVLAGSPSGVPKILLAHQPRSRQRRQKQALTCNYRATPMAANSGHGVCSHACSNRSLQD